MPTTFVADQPTPLLAARAMRDAIRGMLLEQVEHWMKEGDAGHLPLTTVGFCRTKASALHEFADFLALELEVVEANGFNPDKVTIVRHRRSTTQGEVEVRYAGELCGRYGDGIALVDGEWQGQPDEYWVSAARTWFWIPRALGGRGDR
jgi:hypothetical protein